MFRDYVVETTDGSVATMMVATRELMDAGFDPTWLATEETYTDRNRQTRTLKTSVFPKYLFVPFDATDEGWRRIAALRGVKRVMGSSPVKPTPLPVGAVERLKAQFANGEFKLRPVRGVIAGDKVVFEAGSFAGHVGVVKHSKGERIRVLLDFFGAQREVPMRADMVKVLA